MNEIAESNLELLLVYSHFGRKTSEVPMLPIREQFFDRTD